MRFTLSSRRCGDTTRLAEAVKNDPNAYFVTFSIKEAERVSREFDIPRSRCLTHDELVNVRGIVPSRETTKVYIDNFDKFIIRAVHPAAFEVVEVVIKQVETK